MSRDSQLEAIRKVYLGTGETTYKNFANSITLNGFLISKPTFKTCYNGKEIALFNLFQLDRKSYRIFICKSFAQNVIDSLKQVKSVCLINCLGMLANTPRSRFSFQIEQIMITHTYDFALDEPYNEQKIQTTE